MKWLYLLLLSSSFALPPVEELTSREILTVRAQWSGAILKCAGTGSMRPYMVGGETLVCEPYTNQEIKVGMLIIFARWDAPFCLHEVIIVNGKYFVAKGLANAKSDNVYPMKRIRYIVKRVIRIKLT